jgi:exosome complex RNA-binding protein Rrp42 (RNase PH superfamily)
MGFLANNVRSDGRFFSKCRPTTITCGILKRNTAGSSLVSCGKTQVMAAVSPCVGTPAAGGEMGDIVVVSEQDSTYLRRILESCVDLTKLSIAPPKAAWRLQIVIFVINNDGNVRDASLIAAMAALKDTILPRTTVNKEGIVQLLDNDENGTPLSFIKMLIPLTVGICSSEKKGESSILLCDVTTEEEILVETKITMVVNDLGEIGNVECTGRIHSQQLALVAKMAQGRALEVLRLLE